MRKFLIICFLFEERKPWLGWFVTGRKVSSSRYGNSRNSSSSSNSSNGNISSSNMQWGNFEAGGKQKSLLLPFFLGHKVALQIALQRKAQSQACTQIWTLRNNFQSQSFIGNAVTLKNPNNSRFNDLPHYEPLSIVQKVFLPPAKLCVQTSNNWVSQLFTKTFLLSPQVVRGQRTLLPQQVKFIFLLLAEIKNFFRKKGCLDSIIHSLIYFARAGVSEWS